MSIDEIARTATERLSRSATHTLDPSDMLRRLHRSRRRRSSVLVAATLVVTLAVVGGVAAALEGGGRAELPAHRGQSARGSELPPFCTGPVRCLGDRRLRIRITPSVTVTVPSTFRLEPVVNRAGVEFYRLDVERAGVTLLQDAVPVRYDDSWKRDPAAGTTAHSMARWLAQRPFLRDTRLTPRQVAGRTAWLVTGRLRAGAVLSGARRAFPVAPAFASGSFTAGVAPMLPGTFTLVDQPHGGVSVIWSWTNSSDRSQLVGNRPMVTALLSPV